jgi:hypothetical protein
VPQLDPYRAANTQLSGTSSQKKKTLYMDLKIINLFFRNQKRSTNLDSDAVKEILVIFNLVHEQTFSFANHYSKKLPYLGLLDVREVATKRGLGDLLCTVWLCTLFCLK